MPDFLVCAQEARRHHRGQRQRHHQRHENRHRQRHREFPEQPADDAPHQQQRNEHRNQRNTDRYDGEADFAGALERGRERRLALFDIARDVLQHHDGIVDHESDRYGQRHQRQIVQCIAEHPHQRTRAKQRQRHRDARDNGRPGAAQEDEDHHHHQNDGHHQRKLDIFDGGADGQRAIADDLDLDGGRNRRDQPWQLRLDLVDGLDDVGARLFEDDQEHTALAIGPGRLLGIFGTRHRLADIADTQRRAIAIGDDDVVPGVGIEQLIIGVDRVGPFVAVDIALWTVSGGDRDLVADVFQRQTFRHQLGRVDLNPDRGFLLAADKNLRHPRDLADLLRKLGIDRVANRGQGQRIGGRRQQQDR